MNLLNSGDWHYRPTRPRSRRDDYVKTQHDKIEQILDLAEKHHCRFTIQPGDFYDGSVMPHWMESAVIRQLRTQSGVPDILAIYGQHDMRFHSSAVENTPLAVVEAAGAVRILDSKPYVVWENTGGKKYLVAFYGCSWDAEIPVMAAGVDADCNVLVIHRMIVGAEKLWEAQEGHKWALALLRQNPQFHLIVSGDNHQFFTEEYQGRFLVNCGSLMRSTIAQTHHDPAVVVYDTIARTIRTFRLDVAPAASVLNVDAVREREQQDADLAAFADQIRGDPEHIDLDFLGTIHRLSRMEGVEPGIANMVDRIIKLATATEGE